MAVPQAPSPETANLLDIMVPSAALLAFSLFSGDECQAETTKVRNSQVGDPAVPMEEGRGSATPGLAQRRYSAREDCAWQRNFAFIQPRRRPTLPNCPPRQWACGSVICCL